MAQIPQQMVEAHVHEDTSVTLHDVPVPVPRPDEVLIKVIVCGCNPKDWKMPAGILMTIRDCPNSGDDIAGVVASVGDSVTSFRPGDRVAALHRLGAPHGSFAEYAIASEHTTYNLGKNVTFEEAATTPMGSLMAAIGLFGMLKISYGPWSPPIGDLPLLIYGASSNVGAFAVKWAGLMGIHPIVCVAGSGAPLVETLIDRSKGDTIVDHRKGADQLIEDIRAALGARKLEYAFDCVGDSKTADRGSHVVCGKVLDPETGKISHVFPGRKPGIPEHIEQTSTMAGSLWGQLQGRDIEVRDRDVGFVQGGHEFGLVWSGLTGRYLSTGQMKGHPHIVMEGGLSGLEKALKELRAGKVSAKKLVLRIADTAST